MTTDKVLPCFVTNSIKLHLLSLVRAKFSSSNRKTRSSPVEGETGFISIALISQDR